MLAASAPSDLSALRFPVLATPKIDGIRCITMDGVSEFPGGMCLPMCRSLKPVPNESIRRALSQLPVGLDGELVTYRRDLFLGEVTDNFHQCQSRIMTREGVPDFRFMVFDTHISSGRDYEERVSLLEVIDLPPFCVRLMPMLCNTIEDLQQYEALSVAAGYEGICFRTPDSPYKHGRSTLREQYLVKMKRFQTSEAVIIGMTELMHNNCPSALNALGYAERASHKALMVGKNTMGSILVRRADGVEFGVGTGFSETQRAHFWDNRDDYVGKALTYKHQPHGAKDAPRIPVFVGIRDHLDTSQ